MGQPECSVQSNCPFLSSWEISCRYRIAWRHSNLTSQALKLPTPIIFSRFQGISPGLLHVLVQGIPPCHNVEHVYVAKETRLRLGPHQDGSLTALGPRQVKATGSKPGNRRQTKSNLQNAIFGSGTLSLCDLKQNDAKLKAPDHCGKDAAGAWVEWQGQEFHESPRQPNTIVPGKAKNQMACHIMGRIHGPTSCLLTTVSCFVCGCSSMLGLSRHANMPTLLLDNLCHREELLEPRVLRELCQRLGKSWKILRPCLKLHRARASALAVCLGFQHLL